MRMDLRMEEIACGEWLARVFYVRLNGRRVSMDWRETCIKQLQKGKGGPHTVRKFKYKVAVSGRKNTCQISDRMGGEIYLERIRSKLGRFQER